MSVTELKLGGLYIIFRCPAAAKLDQPVTIATEDEETTPAEYQWAFYLHYGEAEGGILYQLKLSGGKLVAKHGNTKDVYSIPGLLMDLKCIAEVSTDSLVKVDRTLRGLDKSLEHLKEQTSMKWALMMMTLLAEGEVIGYQHPKMLKRNMDDWASGSHNLVNGNHKYARVSDPVITERKAVMGNLMGAVAE